MPLKMNLADLAAAARQQGVPEVDCEQLIGLKKANPQLLVIDVREREEWVRGHIPQAVHIARGVLERDLVKIAFAGQCSDENLSTPIVCYCGGGHRSLLAAQSLREMGLTQVSSLAGGFGAWHRSGLSVDT